MVNDIIDGISIKLNQVFGDGKTIYSESIKQGFKEPCFFISVLNPSQKPMLGSRYFRQHPFDVHYFPENEGKNDELQEVASLLLECLEYITLLNGDLVRGIDMNHEIVDGVLHFFVKYNMYVRKVEAPEDIMESFIFNSNTEG